MWALLPSPLSPSLRDAARSARQRSTRVMSSPAPASSEDGGAARLLALGADAAEAAALAPHLASLESSGAFYEEVAARMLRFCRVLGVSASNSARLASTVPELRLDEAELASRLAALRSALPAGTDLATVVGKAPTLLFATTAELAAARAELAFLPPCLLVPLLEAEPTLLQLAHRGPRLPEVKAKLLAGPFAALLPTYEPESEADRQYLRRYAAGALASPHV